VRSDPIGQLLGPRRLGVDIARRAQHRDEDLGTADFAGGAIDDGGFVAGVVDEQLVAGAVHLAHGALETALEAFEQQTELAIAIRLTGVGNGVFFPQQLQGDPFALQFLMQMRKIGFAMARHQRWRSRKQQRLQLAVVHCHRQRPAKLHLAGALPVLGDRPL